MESETILRWVAAILFIAIILGVSSMNHMDQQLDQDVYCEMVGLHKESGNDPGIGWPDYQDTYEEQCLGGNDND
jgi:hypothetical protein